MGTMSGSRALQPSLEKKPKANGVSAFVARAGSSAELDGVDGWEYIELAGTAALPARSSAYAAVHKDYGQGREASTEHSKATVRGNSLAGEGMSSAVQGPAIDMETSMAAWLPQRDPLDAAGGSCGVSPEPMSGTAQLPDGSLTTSARQQGTAEAVQQSEADWVELSLADEDLEPPNSSNADTLVPQHSGSTISEHLPPRSYGSDDSPKILARLGSGQKAHWTAFSNLSAQVSTKGRQLSSHLSDKGKQLMEQAQTSVAAAVAEARQVPAGMVVQRGSEAVQEVTQHLQPQASAGASAMVKDVQQLTAGVKEATADLTSMARLWWQRRSAG